MTTQPNFDLQTMLDGLGQGVLIFGSDGRLILENLAARTFLGTDVTTIRENGWEAMATLLNATQTDPEKMIDTYRDQSLQAERPVRFYVLRGGEHIPCWAASVLSETGEVCTLLTIDMPDWTAMSALIGVFRSELIDAIDSTAGHVDMIERDIDKFHKDKKSDADGLTKRVGGLTRLVGIHMARVSRLMRLFQRLEDIRTGDLRNHIKTQRRKLDLENFLEDLEEELDHIDLVDPETDAHDHRSRLTVTLDNKPAVSAAPGYLTQILQDVLRNAIMYSMKATPITIKVAAKEQSVQIDVRDEGYGIRERERERVFEPFQRARQPQVFSEFGYGLNLYLCKHEVEAMNGRLWFESDENVGTSFSLMLPLWRDVESSTSESESET